MPHGFRKPLWSVSTLKVIFSDLVVNAKLGRLSGRLSPSFASQEKLVITTPNIKNRREKACNGANFMTERGLHELR